MYYPARIEKDGDVWHVSFPNVPEANTSGDTLEEAKGEALCALITAFELIFEDNRTIPMPSERYGSDIFTITVPISCWFKVLFLNVLVESGISKVELANRMGLTKQEVNRMVKLSHNTKVDRLSDAMTALGKRYEIRASH